MIKTLRDFRKALDKMIEEWGYGTEGHIQEDTGPDDILISSPAAPYTGSEISMKVIFVPPRSGDKRGQE